MLRCWRYLLTGVALLLPSGAGAEISILDHSAYWKFFAGINPAGDQVCGIDTSFNDGRAVFVKWFAGSDHLAIQIMRPGWKIPDDVGVPITVEFDNSKTWAVKGVANNSMTALLEWYVAHDTVREFTHVFTASHFMVISFDSGSEKPWVVDLSGNSAMLDRFVKCVLYFGGPNNPYAYANAPMDTQPTQPYVPTPQPYVPPATTRRPAVPTLPPSAKQSPT